MARFVFASIAHANAHCYVYDSDNRDIPRFDINRHFRMFDTMGDGTIAHTPDYGVPQPKLTDYLFSLAQAMLKTEGLIDAVSFDLRPRVDKADIAFAEAVRYKEGKTRYFSVREKKLTASESKRHDKRYEEVCPRHDGTVLSVFNILSQSYYDPWQSYVLMWTILDWFSTEKSTFAGRTMDLLKWNPVSSDDDIDGAYTACLNIVKADALIANSRRYLKHYAVKFEPATVPAESVG
jgi:hypothetical protein